MGCLDEQVVFDLVTGRLTPAARELVHAHLDTCVECRQLVAESARDTDAGSSEDPGPTREAPFTLDRFEIVEVLGAGGMGIVYRARDPRLGRWVALKVVRPRQKDAAPVTDLLREAQSLARLAHPNVTTVFEVGDSARGVFLAMELVEGETLKERLARGPLSSAAAKEVFSQVARGLSAAHAAAIVHGDVKPDNILLGRDGRARLTDFGLADELGRARTLDHAGGTPSYFAPERMLGERATFASDQYAFAASLFEAVTGVRWKERALSARVRVPTELRRIVDRATRPDPRERFPSVLALADVLDGLGDRRRVWQLVAIGIALMLTGASVALFAKLGGDRAARARQAQAAPVYAPGTVGWVELATRDANAETRFYATLFEWHLKQEIWPELGLNTTLFNASGDVGHLYELSKKQRERGVVPHWLPFVKVSTMDSSIAAMKALGGAVVREPHDGRRSTFASLHDPSGAYTGLYQPNPWPGAGAARGSPGSFAWIELETTKPDVAAKFYETWAGWSATGEPEVFSVAGIPAAGIRATEGATRWVVYFLVPDCDASVARAKGLGATVVRAAFMLPGLGRAAELNDPEGAGFGVVEARPAGK